MRDIGVFFSSYLFGFSYFCSNLVYNQFSQLQTFVGLKWRSEYSYWQRVCDWGLVVVIVVHSSELALLRFDIHRSQLACIAESCNSVVMGCSVKLWMPFWWSLSVNAVVAYCCQVWDIDGCLRAMLAKYHGDHLLYQIFLVCFIVSIPLRVLFGFFTWKRFIML